MTIVNPHKPEKGKRIKAPTIEIEDFDYPIFCFKNLHKDFHLDNCIPEEKTALIDQIVKLSTLTWHEIQVTGKHGLGSEKIFIKSLRTGVPKFITPDVTFLLALRFYGKSAFVGHRNRFIFHVIYIDRSFTLYKH